MKDDPTCTGCVEVQAQLCSYICLTPCEVERLASLWGESETFVRRAETWICRHITYGDLSTSADGDGYNLGECRTLILAACWLPLIAPTLLPGNALAIWMVPLSRNGVVVSTNTPERICNFLLQVLSRLATSLPSFRPTIDRIGCCCCP